MKSLLWPVALLAMTAFAEADPAWRARVAPETEPGERLVIRGRVFQTKGGPPAAGTRIFVYQTDVKGIYGPGQGSPASVSRLRAEFTVGPNGEYEIVTIRPGHYPGGGVPAHIHLNLVEGGKPTRQVSEFFFAGDKYLSGKEVGFVLPLRKDAQGRWQGSQDFTLADQ